MLYEGVEVSTRQTSKPQTLPAPIGGLNSRDALAGMEPTDAYMMDNLLPGTTSCKVRQGCEITSNVHSPCTSLDVFTGNGQDLDSLMALNIDGDWYDASTEPSVLIKSGIDGIETVSTMFSTVADNSQHLIVTTNGLDMPWSYDGTAATDLAFTGLNEDGRLLNYVCQYMGRLFWATRDKLGFYYLAPGAIQGAAEWYDLGQLSRYGGCLVGIATYSDDAGDGPHDYIVFITSKGEYLMFFGMDPGDAENWDIVGRYKSAPMVGRKCLLDYAGDLVVLTTEGALQFSQIRKLADTRFEVTALSSKLGDTVLSHAVYHATHGWNMVMYPHGGWLMITLPHSNSLSGLYHHFVMNTTTQAWCRFESAEWNGICWAVSNDNLYFGRNDGTIRRADVGTNDNGQPIRWKCKQAYNYYGTPSYKHYKWAMFLVKSESAAAISANMSVDYKEVAPHLVMSNLDPTPGAIWDVSFWDTDYFGTGPYTQRFIAPFGVYGVTASIWLEGAVQGATLEWFASEVVYELAEGLLG